MPAMRVYLPSVEPVDIVPTRGTPGQALLKTFSMACVSSGRSGEGGTGTTGTTFPSGARCGTMVTLTLGSLATFSSVLWTTSGSSPGKMRQLTLARAVCGSAFGACPPESMVPPQDACTHKLTTAPPQRASQPPGS